MDGYNWEDNSDLVLHYLRVELRCDAELMLSANWGRKALPDAAGENGAWHPTSAVPAPHVLGLPTAVFETLVECWTNALRADYHRRRAGATEDATPWRRHDRAGRVVTALGGQQR